MDLNFTSKEKKLLRLAQEIINKWRNILNIDPIWQFDVSVFDDDDMPGAFARIDTSTAEYFFATIEISYDMLSMKVKDFESRMNDAACHELLHIVFVDMFRSAQLLAGENEAIHSELKYKYEQFTSRLQKSFLQLHNSLDESKNKIEDIKTVLESKNNGSSIKNCIKKILRIE